MTTNTTVTEALEMVAGTTDVEVYLLAACWRFPVDPQLVTRDVVAGAVRFGRIAPKALVDVIEVLRALPDPDG